MAFPYTTYTCERLFRHDNVVPYEVLKFEWCAPEAWGRRVIPLQTVMSKSASSSACYIRDKEAEELR